MIHARTDYDRIQDPENKIGKDEPVFLLRAKDKFAPTTVKMWAAQVRAAGDDRLADYIDSWALKMEFWQKTNECKQPDAPTGVLVFKF